MKRNDINEGKDKEIVFLIQSTIDTLELVEKQFVDKALNKTNGIIAVTDAGFMERIGLVKSILNAEIPKKEKEKKEEGYVISVN